MAYKITMNIQIEETDDASNHGELVQSNRGSFSMTVPTHVGQSIDQCEQALLNVNHTTLRDALSNHLSRLSEEIADQNFGTVKKTTKHTKLMVK